MLCNVKKSIKLCSALTFTFHGTTKAATRNRSIKRSVLFLIELVQLLTTVAKAPFISNRQYKQAFVVRSAMFTRTYDGCALALT